MNIESAYVAGSVVTCANKSLPKKQYKDYLKPYWNSDLSVAHYEMKSLRQEWCRQGRPRDNSSLEYSKYKVPTIA